MHLELFDELREQEFDVHPGQLGENIITRGVDLLALGHGTRLRLGAAAGVEVTGLRNPCAQIEAFMPGAIKAVLHRAAGTIASWNMWPICCAPWASVVAVRGR